MRPLGYSKKTVVRPLLFCVPYYSASPIILVPYYSCPLLFFRKLKAELREMVTVLSWSPASGHPARFFSALSAQARLRAQTVQP